MMAQAIILQMGSTMKSHHWASNPLQQATTDAWGKQTYAAINSITQLIRDLSRLDYLTARKPP